MNTTHYPIQSLLESDLTLGCLDAFARRQVVQNVWRKKNGQWAIVPEPFIDDWDAQERRKIAEHLRQYLAEGGAVFAALGDRGEIVAFSAVSGGRIGPQQEYADLLELHTDNRYRHKGLGRALFLQCAVWAREHGAQKLYISAHSAEESQAFYRSIGCVDALWISREHAEKEPYDCQMEYALLQD